MTETNLDVDQFVEALESNAPRYNVTLSARATELLRDYYQHFRRWNARLHLVAPCSPAEFATRHVLESTLATPFLPAGARLIDVGSGAGLPVIPCLILRSDINATLIEASQKKAIFLREALRIVGARERAEVVAERFEKITAPTADCVTCRALDKFTEMFEQLVRWSMPASILLFFGGHNLREQIERAALTFTAIPIPDSERRFLFRIKR
jgi:16S rRNA (guanine527-N7)-methyltransferase